MSCDLLGMNGEGKKDVKALQLIENVIVGGRSCDFAFGGVRAGEGAFVVTGDCHRATGDVKEYAEVVEKEGASIDPKEFCTVGAEGGAGG